MARRWWVLATVSAGLLLISLDMTILYTALPTLTADLEADASAKLWIINAYPLVMAGLLLGAGTLGDRVGHKRMFLTGLVLFGAASTVAAFAPSSAVLIGARAFLAVGAAAMMPATLALVRLTFDDERERGIAIGIWGTIAVVGAALGPVAGGLLLDHFWWGSVFLVNVPVVLVALVATAVLAPGGSGRRDRPWDPVASVQVMAGLVGLVYAIKEGSRPEPDPLHIAVALLVSAAGFTVFVRRQRTRTYPLIDFALFRSRQLLAGVLGAGLSMFATAGIELILAQRLQLVLGLSPLHAGLLVASSAVGALPAGVVAGSLVYRVPTRHLIGGGLLVGALGAALALLLTPGVGLPAAGHSAGWVIPGTVLMGLGLGAAMTAASAAIIGGAPPHRAGMASSVEEVSFELGSLTGVAVLGSVLTAVYTATVELPAGAPGAASDSLDEARAVAGELPPGDGRSLLEAAASAFDNGYTLTLAVTVAVLAVGGVVTRLLLGHRTAGAAPEEPEEPEEKDSGDGPEGVGATTGTSASPR
ncbi:MFS transporter [Streptomyces sp. WMMC500]|uniref:MFS transporter n=1 Tax=Streptomyces sp. WMMC500 TaxID=3015154 RepID=UPI00248C42B5|nr:MFS transporter [Streptomyces sp. WMMC500]WBB64632.1 MFS transporter [Streptomyces sp. WMMC500]